MIFGSDWPGIRSMSWLLEGFTESGLSDKAIENIVYNNAANILNIGVADCSVNGAN